MTSIAGSPGGIRGVRARRTGSGRDARLLVAADDEAALRAAVGRLERVDHPVAGHVEPPPVGNDGVVGAIAGGEDELAVGGAESEGLGRLQVADVEDVADHAARARDRAIRRLGPALAARASVERVDRSVVGAEIDARWRAGSLGGGRRAVDVAAG